MTRYKSLAVFLSILLAVIVPLLTAVKAHTDRQSYPLVKIEVEPYDPRDLFYGHYMRFGFKWNWAENEPDEKACRGADCCLCIGMGDIDPNVRLVSCKEEQTRPPAQCVYRLTGAYRGDGRFDIGHNRYFVDETIALPLETLFVKKKKKFHVGLYVQPGNVTQLERLYVDGQRVEDFVESGGLEEKIPSAE